MDIESGDDFEMKPLTAGLGFHKKSVSLREHISKTGLSEQAVRRNLPSAPPNELLEPNTNRSSRQIIDELHEALKPKAKPVGLSATLPRTLSEVEPGTDTLRAPLKGPIPRRDPLGKVNFQIPNQSISETVGARRGGHDNLIKPLSPVAVSVPAMLLDAVVVLAMSLIFLVCLVAVTGVKLPSVLASSQGEFATQLSLIVLYLAVFEMYAIISRSFFGATLGEWTFDLQLGSPEQIAKSHYPAMVLWRSLFNLMTGLIVLPLISSIFRRDLAASLTGLQLYRRN
jgi:hypothetical protein